jgi:hypothetical protein
MNCEIRRRSERNVLNVRAEYFISFYTGNTAPSLQQALRNVRKHHLKTELVTVGDQGPQKYRDNEPVLREQRKNGRFDVMRKSNRNAQETISPEYGSHYNLCQRL